MPIPAREDLKAYFETADVPTQAQFGELIDAVYDLSQESQDVADAALAASQLAIPVTGLVRIERIGAPSTSDDEVLKQTGCSVAVAVTPTTTTGSYQRYEVEVTITPTVDFADENFSVQALIEEVDESKLSIYGFTITRAVDEVVIEFQIALLAATETRFQFAIFR